MILLCLNTFPVIGELLSLILGKTNYVPEPLAFMENKESISDMVERVSWMSEIYYSVLGFYADHDIVINPSSIATNIDYEAGYVADVCRELWHKGFLRRYPGPKYDLSEQGRQWLNDELSHTDFDETDIEVEE